MKKNSILFLLAALLSNSTFSQKTYVPDDDFEQVLILHGYDSGPLDDSVNTANIDSLTWIVLNRPIANFTGINDFVSLRHLDIPFSMATELVFDSLPNLTTLEVRNTTSTFTNFDISKLKNLDTLELAINADTIDISNHINLKRFSIAGNIGHLIMRNNYALEAFLSSFSNLDSTHIIDLSKDTNLGFVDLSHNNLTELDLSNNKKLWNLDLENNDIKNIDLSNNIDLLSINLNDNLLDSFNTAHLPVVRDVEIVNNQLKYLNIANGNNPNFIRLRTTGNPLLSCIIIDDLSHVITYNWNFRPPHFDWDATSIFCLPPPCQAGFSKTQLTSAGVYLIDTTQGNNLKYLWFFGDGDSSSSYLPTHTYASAGSYNVCLQITDTVGGCTDLFCDTITIDTSGILRNSWTLSVSKSQPVLSINEFDIVNSVKLFPNPTNGFLNIEFNKSGNYEFYTIDGKKMGLEGKLIAGSNNLDISSFKNGLYLIRVTSENGEVSTERIIKN